MGDKETVNQSINKVKSTVVNFIVPLIASAVCLALVFLVIYPSIKKIPELNTEINTARTLGDQLEAKISNLKKLVDFKGAVDENLTLVNDVLVSEPMVPELLAQVDQIAKEAGLDVSTLTYSTGSVSNSDKEKTSYSTVTVSIGAKGSYDQVTSFFKILENSARIVNVDSFRYTKSDTEEGASTLDFASTLTAPYLKVESSAVTDDTVNLDITSKGFAEVMSQLKMLKVYKPSQEQVQQIQVVETKESTPSEQPTQ
jgi:Tfp pilus assembly protein PilO